MILAKFGGSSLADGRRFQAVRRILLQDPSRRGVVVSAPGRRFPGDEKLTDLLYGCYDRSVTGGDWESLFAAVRARFEEIRITCGIPVDLGGEFSRLSAGFAAGTVTRDEAASRGEYFSARLLAAYLGRQFLDSARWLRFTADGQVDAVRSYGLLRQFAGVEFVTPGFYGAMPDGSIRTLTRGGSDVTGALAAAALEAELYENWTDVPGIFRADPALAPAAEPVDRMTYGELADMSAVGTQVLHEGAVRPVREAGIPLRVCSSFAPNLPGTWIEADPPAEPRKPVVAAAARRERTILSLPGGELERLLTEAEISPDFLLTQWGWQTASIPDDLFSARLDVFAGHLGEMQVQSGVALAAAIFAEGQTVGEGAIARLLQKLAAEGIPVLAVLRPAERRILTLAVPEGRCAETVRILSGSEGE